MKIFLYLTTILTFSFISKNPVYAQSLGNVGGSDVVATAGLGTNKVKVITLTPNSINCLRGLDPYRCVRESKGTYKTSYTIKCDSNYIEYASKSHDWYGSFYVSKDNFSRAAQQLFNVYNYACGTNLPDHY